MTQDEIIEMAREAELAYDIDAVFTFKGNFAQIEAFAKLVTAKAFQNGYEKGVAAFNEAVLEEREACAKLCEQIDTAAFGGERPAPNDCAAAIRARGEA
jgi:hypothetical protein